MELGRLEQSANDFASLCVQFIRRQPREPGQHLAKLRSVRPFFSTFVT